MTVGDRNKDAVSPRKFLVFDMSPCPYGSDLQGDRVFIFPGPRYEEYSREASAQDASYAKYKSVQAVTCLPRPGCNRERIRQRMSTSLETETVVIQGKEDVDVSSYPAAQPAAYAYAVLTLRIIQDYIRL